MDESSPNRNPVALPVKLQKLVPMLGSPVDGERLAATHAIERVIRDAGLTFHDLAARLAAEPKISLRRRATAPDPDEALMVEILGGRLSRLATGDAIFIRALQSVLDHGHRLTETQRRHLNALFDKLE